jgi:hypothetical protein
LKLAHLCVVRQRAGKRSPIYSVEFNYSNETHTFSTGTTIRKDAVKFQQKKAQELMDNGTLRRASDAARVSDLRSKLEAHCEREDNRSLRRAGIALAKFETFFKSNPAVSSIRKTELEAFDAKRAKEGASRATRKYELAIFRKCTKLAV